jgi:hypothetical protein
MAGSWRQAETAIVADSRQWEKLHEILEFARNETDAWQIRAL